MNELLSALEAMIRRVVQEEMARNLGTVGAMANNQFKSQLEDYVVSNKADWASLLSVGALDMPWFDEAIKAEATAAAAEVVLPASAGITEVKLAEEFSRFLTSRPLDQRIVSVITDSDRFQDWFQDEFSNQLSNVSFSTTVD